MPVSGGDGGPDPTPPGFSFKVKKQAKKKWRAPAAGAAAEIASAGVR